MADGQEEAAADLDEAADPPSPPGRRNIWPWVLLGMVTCFSIGMLGSPWLEARVRGHLPQPEATVASPAPDFDGVEARLRRLETSQSITEARDVDPDIAARVEALEARAQAQAELEAGFLASLQQLSTDLQRARLAIDAGDAQVRDLFLLALVRRMLAAGRPLDPVMPLLVERHRTRDAAALEALAAWSNEPQSRETLANLLAEIDGAGKRADAESAGWWQRLKTGFGGLVRLHDSARSDGLADAGVALRRNDLQLAIRHVEALPESAELRQWVHDARLLVEAESALERLDAAALSTAIAAVSRGEAATTSND